MAGASAQDLTEPETQAAFIKEFKDKSATKREVALRRMVGLKEEKSLQLLAGALKDPDATVRKAAAEVIATCTDSGGAAIKPLCAILTNKKEDKDVRLACARALAKAQYKAEPIDALVQTIAGIGEQDKDLFAFGAECTRILNEVAGQDFGAGKETPDKWKKWWKENQGKTTKDDQEKLAAYKKSGSGKK
jgi:hypothetical protein